MSSIYIPNEPASGGVTIGYLERNYSKTNFINAQLSTKLSLTGTSQMQGSIIPSTDDLYDLGSVSLRFKNIYATSLTTQSISDNLEIITGEMLGLNMDGVTDDGILLQNALNIYEDSGQPATIIINSNFGMAIHQNVIKIPSNIHLMISCPVYAYGDVSFRTFGEFEELVSSRMVAPDVTTSTNILKVADSSLFTANQVCKIRGLNVGEYSIETETNIIVSIDYGTHEITFLNNFRYDYLVDNDPPNNDITNVVGLISTYQNTGTLLRGDIYMTVTDSTAFQIGDIVLIKDYALIKNIYPSNTSNNTFRDDVNKIVDINYGTHLITFENPIVTDYLPTTDKVFILKLKSTNNTILEGINMIYKKNPTNRNAHPFFMGNSFNCEITKCSVPNIKRNENIIINATTGNNITVIEQTSGLSITYSIPYGIYKFVDLCELVENGLKANATLQSSTLVYSCSYSSTTGKITISATGGNFRLPYVAGRALCLLGFIHSDTAYPNGTTFTGERVDLSGNFLLPASQNRIYLEEPIDGLQKIIAFSTTDFFSLGTLMKTVENALTANSTTGYTYSVAYSDSTNCITISTTGTFLLYWATYNDTIFRYLGFHSAKGIIGANNSGASSYSTETLESVPIRLTMQSKGHAFRVDASLNCRINECYVGGSSSVSSGESYGFAVYRCRGNIISNCVAMGQRHSLLFQTANNNIVNGFYSSDACISDIDFHGLNSRNNLVSNVICVYGPSVSPDATTKTALKIGNTSHVAGDSYNVISNFSMTGYSKSYTTYGIFLYPISNNNVIDNFNCDSVLRGFTVQDVSSKDSAEFVINDNIIKNSTFQNVVEPFYLNMSNNSTLLTSCNRLIIDNCIFKNIGSGSASESRGTIQNRVNDCLIRNCIFKDLVSGSNDVETIYFNTVDDLVITGCLFDNVKRGIYSDNVNNNYIISDNEFINLTGASQVVLRDDNNSVGGVFSLNKYYTSIPRLNASSNVLFTEINNRRWQFTSNASVGTNITSTLPLSTSTVTSGGANVMGTTNTTYSSKQIYGVLDLSCFMHYTLPGTLSAKGHVIGLLFYTLSGVSSLIGSCVQSYDTTEINQTKTMRISGFLSITDRLSSASSSFQFNMGDTNGNTILINNAFQQFGAIVIKEGSYD